MLTGWKAVRRLYVHNFLYGIVGVILENIVSSDVKLKPPELPVAAHIWVFQ